MRPATTAPCSAWISCVKVSVRSSFRLRVTLAILSALILMCCTCMQGQDLLHAVELRETRSLSAAPQLVGLAVTRDFRIHQGMRRTHAVHRPAARIKRELYLAGDALLAGCEKGFQIPREWIKKMALMQQLAVEIAERVLPELLLAAEHQFFQLTVRGNQQVRGRRFETHAPLDTEN